MSEGISGFVAPGFEGVRSAFARNFEDGAELGASFAAIHDGEVVAELWGGHADRARATPWARDTLAPVYSTTKAISAIVVARLVDAGLIRYDDKVSALWPAFAAHGKSDVTIAQALSHQAGVPGFPDPIDPELWLDPPACAEAIAALAPMWPPGTASGYHPLTWGYIVGEIVRRAGGRSLGTILREDICGPLGVDFHVGLPEAEHARAAEMMKPSQVGDFGTITPIKRAAFLTKWAAPARGAALWRRIEIPSANGHGTALAIARLCELFATGGVIAGARVLSPAGYAQLTQSRIVGQDLVLPFMLDWSAGVLANSNGFYGPNAQAHGHSGAGGSCGFGDPVRQISAAYVMSKQSHHLMGDPRGLRIIEALYACLS
ncbi:MAG TPA: serine hydrolase domain-containing protein [Caulobacterales bacterium]|nr:serine hydrolase domain-containing protein [Caulobacterales bacterium]